MRRTGIDVSGEIASRRRRSERMARARYRAGMRVVEIWRYPVKSMGGETLLEAEVTDLGIAGDRGWSVYDVETGTTLTARRSPDLLFASARVVAGDVVVTLPDGSQIGDRDDDALSAWLGREVELRSAGDHDLDVGGTYEAPLDAENDANWVTWQGPGGAFHDSSRSRVSLVSRTTLRDWDRRRFRSNVVTDGSGEDDLVGAAVSIGRSPGWNVTSACCRRSTPNDRASWPSAVSSRRRGRSRSATRSEPVDRGRSARPPQVAGMIAA